MITNDADLWRIRVLTHPHLVYSLYLFKKRKKIHPVTLVTNYLYLISDLCPLNNKR
ncbi:hypothetical protein M074_3441 [Bacteroides fragilis str. DS-166]|nr:hypothetical protein M074_3441 [Bacteroides fragilis str. DS-166]